MKREDLQSRRKEKEQPASEKQKQDKYPKKSYHKRKESGNPVYVSSNCRYTTGLGQTKS